MWVVIPAYNEEHSVRGVVQPLVERGYHVVVVDDASADGTRQALDGSGVHYLRHICNVGQGGALETGMRYARRCGAKYVVTFDADGQHDLHDIPRMIEVLRDGHADVVLGSRFLRGGSARGISLSRRLVLRIATWFTRLVCGVTVTDTHNGLRAMTAEASATLRITHNRMSHATEILQKIRANGLRYREVPVNIRYTAYSKTKGQSSAQAIVIVSDMLKGLLRT